MKRTRSRMALFVSLGVLLLCAACGAGGNEPAPAAEETSNTASNATQTVTPSAADKQRVVKSMKGDITVPADPARVIGTTVTYPEFLFALGITPVAAENYHEEFPSYFNGAFKEVIDLGAVDSPNFEAVLAAEPISSLRRLGGMRRATTSLRKSPQRCCCRTGTIGAMSFGISGKRSEEWRKPNKPFRNMNVQRERRKKSSIH